MEMKVWMPAMLICAAAVCLGLAGNGNTAISDAQLGAIYGGDDPWDCIGISSDCAGSVVAGHCDFVNGYCSRGFIRSTCYQPTAECQQSASYTDGCNDLILPCSSWYTESRCSQVAPGVCDWVESDPMPCSGTRRQCEEAP